MKITIQSPGFKATKTLLDFATKKLQNLHHLNETILEGIVCLKINKPEIPENKTCEIKLAIPGNDLFASKDSKTFEEAITKVVNALKHQLSDVKPNYKEGHVKTLEQ
jgi:putative sigma-54 modulation protein